MITIDYMEGQELRALLGTTLAKNAYATCVTIDKPELYGAEPIPGQQFFTAVMFWERKDFFGEYTIVQESLCYQFADSWETLTSTWTWMAG